LIGKDTATHPRPDDDNVKHFIAKDWRLKQMIMNLAALSNGPMSKESDFLCAIDIPAITIGGNSDIVPIHILGFIKNKLKFKPRAVFLIGQFKRPLAELILSFDVRTIPAIYIRSDRNRMKG
jgi:hypothetical protein